MNDKRDIHEQQKEPDVMFLPLAATPCPAWGEFDAGVVARRIPDFMHQMLNQGHPGPTAMLELQSAADSGPVTWVDLDAPPEREEAFDLMPPQLTVRVVVTGEVEPVDGGLRLELHLYRDEESDDFVTETMGVLLSRRDPVAGLMKLTRRLARVLALPFHEPQTGLLTDKGAAFMSFLRGLDNAMLLSGDLEIAVPEDRGALIQPFADAIERDPAFGLALRIANATAALALNGARIERDEVRSFMDRCYSAHPVDGEACVAVAEQLSDMGDEDRALAWLEYATELDAPPSRGLESLGILKARRGDPDAARGLWQRGISLDGHPDFFSHLAQLSFVEGDAASAWDLVERGLRRLRERTLRAAEWTEGDRGAGVLLECLQMHLADREAPSSVAAALVDLRGLLTTADRLPLGLCLLAIGATGAARVEVTAGMRAVRDPSTRDQAVRAMLRIDVVDFEARFAKATEKSLRGRNPRAALADFRLWLHLQPEFWPALYYSGIAKRRLGELDEALDLQAAALEVMPEQPDVLFEMSELFAHRQNSKRALELIEQALGQRYREPRLHEAKARYLQGLGRLDEAREVVAVAITAGLESPSLRRLGRSLCRD